MKYKGEKVPKIQKKKNDKEENGSVKKWKKINVPNKIPVWKTKNIYKCSNSRKKKL